MSLQVLVLSGQLTPPLYVECAGRQVTLGRAPTSDVRLPDPTVSSTHATLRKRGAHYLIVDEGSTNGTALLAGDQTPPIWLTAGSPRVLKPGERLLLGAVEIQVRQDGGAEGPASHDLARDLVTAGLASLGLEVTEAAVDAALVELTASPDEPLAHAAPALAVARIDDGGVVSEQAARWEADVVVLAAALVLLALSCAGLYWLIG